jgi:hypothetical protein
LKLTVDKGLMPEQLATLEELMKSTGQDCMGMPMIFTIASAVKDWLVANNVDSGVRDSQNRASCLRLG